MAGTISDLFANEALRNVLFKTRYLLAFVALVPLAYFAHPEWFPAAIAISMAGQLIQTWCFASLVKNRELTVRGPYLLCRNPMYVGRYFLILGFVCLLSNLIAVVVYTLVYYFYMVGRVAREESRLRRYFGEDYAAYCRNVNRFLPSLRNLRDRKVWFFNREMFLENNAHWNIVLTVTAYAAVYGIWWGINGAG